MDVRSTPDDGNLGTPSADEVGYGAAPSDAGSDAGSIAVPGPEDALDLTPRATPVARSGTRRRSLAFAAILVLLAVAGAVAVRSLSNATVFFYTADEALTRRQELAGRRFRLEGSVVPGTVQRTAEGVEFKVSDGVATLAVEHVGDPPEMFQPCIPVVLEGSWADAPADGAVGGAPTFASDNIMVKHSEQYTEKNAERMLHAQQAVAEGRCPVDAASGGSKAP